MLSLQSQPASRPSEHTANKLPNRPTRNQQNVSANAAPPAPSSRLLAGDEGSLTSGQSSTSQKDSKGILSPSSVVVARPRRSPTASTSSSSQQLSPTRTTNANVVFDNKKSQPLPSLNDLSAQSISGIHPNFNSAPSPTIQDLAPSPYAPPKELSKRAQQRMVETKQLEEIPEEDNDEETYGEFIDNSSPRTTVVAGGNGGSSWGSRKLALSSTTATENLGRSHASSSKPPHQLNSNSSQTAFINASGSSPIHKWVNPQAQTEENEDLLRHHDQNGSISGGAAASISANTNAPPVPTPLTSENSPVQLSSSSFHQSPNSPNGGQRPPPPANAFYDAHLADTVAYGVHRERRDQSATIGGYQQQSPNNESEENGSSQPSPVLNKAQYNDEGVKPFVYRIGSNNKGMSPHRQPLYENDVVDSRGPKSEKTADPASAPLSTNAVPTPRPPVSVSKPAKGITYESDSRFTGKYNGSIVGSTSRNNSKTASSSRSPSNQPSHHRRDKEVSFSIPTKTNNSRSSSYNSEGRRLAGQQPVNPDVHQHEETNSAASRRPNSSNNNSNNNSRLFASSSQNTSSQYSHHYSQDVSQLNTQHTDTRSVTSTTNQRQGLKTRQQQSPDFSAQNPYLVGKTSEINSQTSADIPPTYSYGRNKSIDALSLPLMTNANNREPRDELEKRKASPTAPQSHSPPAQPLMFGHSSREKSPSPSAVRPLTGHVPRNGITSGIAGQESVSQNHSRASSVNNNIPQATSGADQNILQTTRLGSQNSDFSNKNASSSPTLNRNSNYHIHSSARSPSYNPNPITATEGIQDEHNTITASWAERKRQHMLKYYGGTLAPQTSASAPHVFASANNMTSRNREVPLKNPPQVVHNASYQQPNRVPSQSARPTEETTRIPTRSPPRGPQHSANLANNNNNDTHILKASPPRPQIENNLAFFSDDDYDDDDDLPHIHTSVVVHMPIPTANPISNMFPNQSATANTFITKRSPSGGQPSSHRRRSRSGSLGVLPTVNFYLPKEESPTSQAGLALARDQEIFSQGGSKSQKAADADRIGAEKTDDEEDTAASPEAIALRKAAKEAEDDRKKAEEDVKRLWQMRLQSETERIQREAELKKRREEESSERRRDILDGRRERGDDEPLPMRFGVEEPNNPNQKEVTNQDDTTDQKSLDTEDVNRAIIGPQDLEQASPQPRTSNGEEPTLQYQHQPGDTIVSQEMNEDAAGAHDELPREVSVSYPNERGESGPRPQTAVGSKTKNLDDKSKQWQLGASEGTLPTSGENGASDGREVSPTPSPPAQQPKPSLPLSPPPHRQQKASAGCCSTAKNNKDNATNDHEVLPKPPSHIPSRARASMERIASASGRPTAMSAIDRSNAEDVRMRMEARHARAVSVKAAEEKAAAAKANNRK